LLDVIPDSRHFIGLKLTGDAVLGVVTDLRAQVVAQGQLALTDRSPTAVVAKVAQLIAELREHVGVVIGIGLGIGGLVDASGLVVNAPFLDWENVELAGPLESASGLPVVIANDLIAFTEYERWFGGGRNLDRFVVITLGAGIGYGLVAGGQVVTSADSGLGLIGHWPVDPYGPLCSAGHRGCARVMLAQEAIATAAAAARGRPTSYEAALDLASDGDPAARAVVDAAGRGLGHLIGDIANVTMPQLVILGGEGVRLVSVAAEAVTAGIADRRDPRATDLDLLTTSGDDAEWCRGAAALALQAHALGDKNLA